MKHPKYSYRSEDLRLFYEFTSEGPNGLIKKVVEYTKTNIENVYNLGFGDYDENTKSINDLSITNNKDSLKVLATVASTVYTFTEKYPKAWILATGSTDARTRLYRMGISSNFSEISEDFIIFGYSKKGYWDVFMLGKDYEAFLITKKDNKFAL